jgi:hypothetical protein
MAVCARLAYALFGRPRRSLVVREWRRTDLAVLSPVMIPAATAAAATLTPSKVQGRGRSLDARILCAFVPEKSYLKGDQPDSSGANPGGRRPANFIEASGLCS